MALTAPQRGAVEQALTRPATPQLTMGVEEEFLLVDRRSRAPAGRAPRVIDAARPLLGMQVQREFFTVQVEACTAPTASLTAIREELARNRAVLRAAAAGEDCLLVASGTAVIPSDGPLTVTEGARYQRMSTRYAAVLGARDRVVCGCHVHIGVTCRAQALALANHLRPWLPVLQSIAANSPYSRGRDTGYASRRAVDHARWPTVGPAPVLDEDSYERLANALVRGGTLLDRAMIYWYARPSEHVPTVEIRVADSNADIEVTVLLAALVRGLATALLPEADRGGPPPVPPCELLCAAHRQAARHGLEGAGLDLATGLHVPAWHLVDRLLVRAAPGLEAAGDLARVAGLLDRLRTTGTGAARQREAFRRHGRLSDVVDGLARTTAAA
ncbi:hypothetical protein DEJ50_31485 [Streptomyces venezuelae]|uniref:Putative glutamate--cysteine ligase 2 n=1 Tax=Streptomyces venezuelae TaxID=54571 RepID=A0A5P2D972_STRVZ|nr:glutamate--cysteine ligase [Streptomyces venezuelae]QES51704.1 hypothetical protein DEJ50_31485 [Streptomyces venezuelae]